MLCMSALAVGQGVQVGGYLKYMPSQTFINKSILPPIVQDLYPSNFDDHLIHNRINVNWATNKAVTESNWEMELGVRNRVFYGFQSDQATFRTSLEYDPGLVDMRWLWTDGDVLLHSEIDRLNATYRKGDLMVRVGRQRINWGVNNVFNPNDIFNQYNYFDFDYEERPGADAVLAQYYLGDGFSSIEVAASPNFEHPDQGTYAALYKSNYKGYDWQVLAGYTYYDMVIGGGWAGSIGGMGFQGEMAYYGSTNEQLSQDNFTGSLGFDYMFSSGVYASLSYLYNQNPSSYNMLNISNVRLSSKNIFPYYHTIMASANYPLSPLWGVNLAYFQAASFDQLALIPGVTYSISNNWDAMLIAQIFGVATEEDKIAMYSTAIYARLKWSF